MLIAAPGRSPVVVEAEYEPAAEVVRDANERLGLRVEGQPRTVKAAITVRYQKAVPGMPMMCARPSPRLVFSYCCVLNQDGSRFPESGWLEGSTNDLADLARLVSVRPSDFACDISPNEASGSSRSRNLAASELRLVHRASPGAPALEDVALSPSLYPERPPARPELSSPRSFPSGQS